MTFTSSPSAASEDAHYSTHLKRERYFWQNWKVPEFDISSEFSDTLSCQNMSIYYSPSPRK